jgi:predicted Zn finger-like uncharacterized protein
MILTCPACSTRYEADAAKFPPQGRQVRCAKCSHVWHQAGPDASAAPPAPQPEPAMAEAAAASAAAEAQVEEVEPVARLRAQMAAATSRTAPPRPPVWPLIGIALGWVGLIAIILLIGLSAVRYRQEIAAIWPQSAGVYEKLGMPVKMLGLDFEGVNYHRESEDGQLVLAVTGQIVNKGARELAVPQSVRVTLSDAANHELYHWNFKPPVSSLRAGQISSFTTRLSSPPAGARHLEVRFAPPPAGPAK